MMVMLVVVVLVVGAWSAARACASAAPRAQGRAMPRCLKRSFVTSNFLLTPFCARIHFGRIHFPKFFFHILARESRRECSLHRDPKARVRKWGVPRNARAPSIPEIARGAAGVHES
jgi:hypothetical protein